MATPQLLRAYGITAAQVSGLLLDLDTGTTAEILAISGSTVTTHLHRAIGALRRDVPARDVQELTQ